MNYLSGNICGYHQKQQQQPWLLLSFIYGNEMCRLLNANVGNGKTFVISSAAINGGFYATSIWKNVFFCETTE